MVVYGINGLGADRRVYEGLNKFLKNKIVPIDWVLPLENETIEEYSKRFYSQVKKNDEEVVLVGVSFGGIVAVEMAKLFKVKKVILISSIASVLKLPNAYKLIGRLGINKIIPFSMFNPPSILTSYLFGVNKPENKLLLNDIIRNTDKSFLKWAIDKIVNWKSITVPENLIKINGTNDRILPLEKGDYEVAGGGHFMIVENAEEIAGIINKELD